MEGGELKTGAPLVVMLDPNWDTRSAEAQHYRKTAALLAAGDSRRFRRRR